MQRRNRFSFELSSVAFILALTLLAVSCSDKRQPTAAARPASDEPISRSLPPLPNRPPSPELRAVRAKAMRTASSLRELPWISEVGIAELSGWEYGTRANEMARILGGDELHTLGRLAAAGGALPEGIDLATLAASFTSLSAGAAYSPLDKQILLIDKKTSSSVLTHEFVHALQDQHFDLLKLLVVRPFNFDRAQAAFAIVEGDAVNVQRRSDQGDDYASRSLDDIWKQENDRFAEYREKTGDLFPPLLTESFIFRYRDGARFIEAVRRKGGEQSIDALFRQPPDSSEQILHIEKFWMREMPIDPAPDITGLTANNWRLSIDTSFGEIGVRGALAAGMPWKDAVSAASGWGGDRALLLERDGGRLFVWKTVWDQTTDAVEFFKAYDRLMRQRGATPQGDTSNASQMTWRESEIVTVCRLNGSAVTIVRGVEADVYAALPVAVISNQ